MDIILSKVIAVHPDGELAKKGYRLIANLALDSTTDVLRAYGGKIVELVWDSVKTDDDDLTLVALSALNNVLYYDFPEDSILDDKQRCNII